MSFLKCLWSNFRIRFPFGSRNWSRGFSRESTWWWIFSVWPREFFLGKRLGDCRYFVTHPFWKIIPNATMPILYGNFGVNFPNQMMPLDPKPWSMKVIGAKIWGYNPANCWLCVLMVHGAWVGLSYRDPSFGVLSSWFSSLRYFSVLLRQGGGGMVKVNLEVGSCVNVKCPWIQGNCSLFD